MSIRDRCKKPILIHVCKDRTLSYRAGNEPIFNGVALPVYSVDTKEEAATLCRIAGCLQYTEHPEIPGKPWYKIQLDFKHLLEVDDLEEVSRKLERFHATMKPTKRAKRKGKA